MFTKCRVCDAGNITCYRVPFADLEGSGVHFGRPDQRRQLSGPLRAPRPSGADDQRPASMLFSNPDEDGLTSYQEALQMRDSACPSACLCSESLGKRSRRCGGRQSPNRHSKTSEHVVGAKDVRITPGINAIEVHKIDPVLLHILSRQGF